jgi:hypothetical protein
MPTNQTTVTTSEHGIYPSTLYYTQLTMIDQVDHKEQLLLFREGIESIFGSSLSVAEVKRMGQIPSAWLTLDVTNRTITAITIPPSTNFIRDNGTSVSYPAMVNGESIVVNRVNIISEPYVSWTTGSRITADQLNLNTAHLLGLIQEVTNTANKAILLSDNLAVLNPLESSLNAAGFGITNLPNPTGAQDVATKAYVDAQIASNVTAKLGSVGGIATLDGAAILTTAQRPGSSGVLPGSFFATSTAPTRSEASGNGLFLWGSLWFNTTNGRLYVYTTDDRYTGLPTNTNGEIGYWVDVSAPAQ